MKKRRKKSANRNFQRKKLISRQNRSADNSLTSLSNAVLLHLYRSKKALSLQELTKQFPPPAPADDTVTYELTRLHRLGHLATDRKKRFSISPGTKIYEANLLMNPAGFGFGTDLCTRDGNRIQANDPYISQAHLGSARHGDRVLLLVSDSRRRGKTEAVIIGIIERKQKTLVGYFFRGNKQSLVHPEDPRFPSSVTIDHSAQSASGDISDGDAVIVSLNSSTDESSRPHGRILEVLGNPDRIEVQVRMVTEKYALPHQFSPQALEESLQVDVESCSGNREDLLDILHFTVDGDDAKDFDDAISVQKMRNGYRLYVSIADVSAFVKPGSKLDLEAYDRGTSIYLPTTVIPMLPENLSNNLCSLVAGEDRLTVTAILDFDGNGELLKKRFARSIICSSMRFTYDQVEKIVVDSDPGERRTFKSYLTPLKWAAELAKALQKKREKRGSIAFTLSEPYIVIDKEGHISAIERKQSGFANQIIEEFMLAANEAVAQTFAERGHDTLYRIHERPDPEKITDFVAFSKTLGLQLPAHQATPHWYNKLLAQVKGRAPEYIVNNLLLRTMQQARYSHENVGHFGLSAEFYTHFTSPIRRYPDLIVHRLLCRLIDNKRTKSNSNKVYPCKSIKEAGLHLSNRERLAITAERDMTDRLKCRFMASKIGETFEAVVSSVSDSLFYVELVSYFISGVVLLSGLTDDYYLLDKKNHRLIGDVSGNILKTGDIIEVTLLDVELGRNKIFFTIKKPLSANKSISTKHQK